MTLFQYPKDRHRRTLNPRQFKRYRTYKRYLQVEFKRVCVYCRQPDSSAPNLNFGVDHYRPKSVPRFKSLVCEYQNLYYCCGGCNTRKNDYWPIDDAKGPFIVAPCEHEMAAHLRFNSKSGRIEARSIHGAHTEDLLQLNDEALVSYRLGALKIVDSLRRVMSEAESLMKKLEAKYRLGEITSKEIDEARDEHFEELNQLRTLLDAHEGSSPTKPIPKSRLGVAL
ncbi:hypothetical protein [Methyloversatilis sp. XJ19-49]|uniref:hypothetical protein n=1 Tax=Methyloversatilis sp. XJ19-49 TaxID=2963429 RepID=UPI00211CA12E|nr:hypothetical protein [Methyloversatilis sp. XJ19-49]MCQ9378833.1 hypothetical protein [Methyloversatilis sp. XJ19-49]